MIAFEGRPRDESLDAAASAAEAGAPGILFCRHPGQGRVPPFTGDGVTAGQNPSLVHQTAADAGANNHAEDRICTLGRAIGRFGDGETVRIVRHPDLPIEMMREIPIKRPADQPCRVRILDQSCGRRDCPGYADPDRRGSLGRGIDPRDELGDCCEGCRVVATRRRDARARDLYAGVVEHNSFDFGAAEVDSDAHVVGGRG